MKRSLLLLALVAFVWACATSTKQEEKQNSTPINYQALGDSITNIAQKTFLGALMKVLSQKGTVEAINFCNLHALSLADSLSRQYQCTIQRLSDRYRNPADRPDANDSTILAEFHATKAMGKLPEPRLVTTSDQVIYYKPIVIGMPTCLQCHGNPTSDIAPATLAVIREKYPQDKAVEYQQGDLRGMWKITFRKN
ncbi:MAG: DUF3365 domain-containing protein [Cytophagales bacterium]|nr:DUF3365 domain-containing protein [Bernardetiaceae bacterium]MDW8211360.1 DUF3365 domain-containing protein [Cytophagales bacterium]